MTALWAERCAPSPAWAGLAEFATAAEARTSWTAAVETRDGAPIAHAGGAAARRLGAGGVPRPGDGGGAPAGARPARRRARDLALEQ